MTTPIDDMPSADWDEPAKTTPWADIQEVKDLARRFFEVPILICKPLTDEEYDFFFARLNEDT